MNAKYSFGPYNYTVSIMSNESSGEGFVEDDGSVTDGGVAVYDSKSDRLVWKLDD
jgi:hypothetical protein